MRLINQHNCDFNITSLSGGLRKAIPTRGDDTKWVISPLVCIECLPNFGNYLSLGSATRSVNLVVIRLKLKKSLCFFFVFPTEGLRLNFFIFNHSLAIFLLFQTKKIPGKKIKNYKSYSLKTNN